MPDFKYKGKIYYNPVQLVREQIGGTWKALSSGNTRTAPCALGNCATTSRIYPIKCSLHSCGNEKRTALSTEKYMQWFPSNTEYSLTALGVEILKLITTIRNYGIQMIENQCLKNHTAQKRRIAIFSISHYIIYK